MKRVARANPTWCMLGFLCSFLTRNLVRGGGRVMQGKYQEAFKQEIFTQILQLCGCFHLNS